MKIKTVDTLVVIATAIWIHLFNYLFVYFSGLSSAGLQVLVFLSLPIMLLLIVRNRKVYYIDFKIIYIMILFSLSVLLSVMFLLKLEVLIRGINFMYLNFFVLIYLSSIKDGFKKLIEYYAYIGILILVYLFFKVQNIEIRSDLDVAPNYIGLVVLTIGIAAVMVRKWQVKMLLFVLSFLVITTISSRSALLCLMLVIIFDAYWIKRYGFLNIKRKKIKILMVSIFVILFLALFTENIISLFALNDDYRGLGTGMSGRDVRWRAAIESWFLNPLFGIGYGESVSYLGFTVDNAYFTILVELGLIGFIFYLFLNGYILLLCYRKNLKIEFVFIFIYLVYGLFEKRYFSVGNSFSILYVFYIYYSFLSTDFSYKKLKFN